MFVPWRGMDMSIKIKICGITRCEDAVAALDAGADALGFMFYASSPRRVSPETAWEIIHELPPFIAKVGVFVDATEELVRSVVAETGVDTLQFHGGESPEFCRKFRPLKCYKAFRIRDAASLSNLALFDTDAWLLDSFVPDKLGGSGATFSWDLAVEAKRLGRPIILAGGLTPGNVADAVRLVQPYALDVSSGVESEPGKKQAAKMRAFIKAARAAADEPAR
jgi:phosphoribosylanthranilate isomerase